MRRQTGNLILALSALSLFGLSTIIPNSTADSRSSKVARTNQEPKEFDRLDGKGPSGKKVDVIEWENNLEIHVYPKGSLRALGMKIDRTNKDKPVMVIEYAFHGTPYTLIRRAILGIPMKDGFKTFQDPAADGYDKIIVSMNTLAGGVQPYVLAPEPTQLYPDHHPALLAEEASEKLAKEAPKDQPAKTYQRKNASEDSAGPRIQLKKASEYEQELREKRRRRGSETDGDGEERIRNFAF